MRACVRRSTHYYTRHSWMTIFATSLQTPSSCSIGNIILADVLYSVFSFPSRLNHPNSAEENLLSFPRIRVVLLADLSVPRPPTVVVRPGYFWNVCAKAYALQLRDVYIEGSLHYRSGS